MTHDEQRPDRHLHPVHLDEPPEDPYADNPPQPGEQRHDGGRGPIHDHAAERALLGSLIAAPDLGRNLAHHVTADDFWNPAHADLWTTWHTLANDLPDDQAPDPVLLNAHATATKQTELARLVTDLWLNDKACPNPLNGEGYAKTVRDAARLRAVDAVSTTLHQLAISGRPDTIDATLGEALQRLDDTVTRFGPAEHTKPAALHDLSWILHGEPPVTPPPIYVTRTDGTALFYKGLVNGLFGDPEHGKTWAAQIAAVEALNAGGTAAMIDVDHNGANHTAARLLLLGAHIEHLADPTRFRYYEPHDGDDLLEAVADLVRTVADVTIIDSLGEIFPMLGVSTNDGDEITSAMRKVCTRPAAAGSCVITIDHLPKGVDARQSGFAIGSIAKKRMIRGAYIRAEAKVKPAPGQTGRIKLIIEKDTTGELRRSSGGSYAGTLTLDSTQDHTVAWSIDRDAAPRSDDGTFRPTIVMEKVSRYVEDNDQCGLTDIRRAVGGKSTVVDEAIATLAREGFLSVIDNGPGKRSPHHSNVAYRQDEDDHLHPTP